MRRVLCRLQWGHSHLHRPAGKKLGEAGHTERLDVIIDWRITKMITIPLPAASALRAMGSKKSRTQESRHHCGSRSPLCTYPGMSVVIPFDNRNGPMCNWSG